MFCLKPKQKGKTDSLHGHLGHHAEAVEALIGEVLLILAHLDGVQPLVHRGKGGEVWRAAVQQRQMNTGYTGDRRQEIGWLSGEDLGVDCGCVWREQQPR